MKGFLPHTIIKTGKNGGPIFLNGSGLQLGKITVQKGMPGTTSIMTLHAVMLTVGAKKALPVFVMPIRFYAWPLHSGMVKTAY